MLLLQLIFDENNCCSVSTYQTVSPFWQSERPSLLEQFFSVPNHFTFCTIHACLTLVLANHVACFVDEYSRCAFCICVWCTARSYEYGRRAGDDDEGASDGYSYGYGGYGYGSSTKDEDDDYEPYVFTGGLGYDGAARYGKDKFKLFSFHTSFLAIYSVHPIL